MKKTVLLVEDDDSLVNAVKIKLEKSGFSVICANTANDALKCIHGDPPVDVIWLDHYLLGAGTGIDVLEQTRNSAAYKDIPAFIVSNTASPEKRRAYLRLGATQFYVKAEHRLEEIISSIQATLGGTTETTSRKLYK